jgi:hypothetical protein
VPQQSAEDKQLEPWPEQRVQLPLSQVRPLQQSAVPAHPLPEPPQGFLQVPPEHSRPSQQSVSLPHAAPSGAQHWPAWHESGVQHSALVVQLPPAGAHSVHTPALQMFEQQSLASVHAEPAGLHELHAPFTQLRPPQHGVGPVQL